MVKILHLANFPGEQTNLGLSLWWDGGSITTMGFYEKHYMSKICLIETVGFHFR